MRMQAHKHKLLIMMMVSRAIYCVGKSLLMTVYSTCATCAQALGAMQRDHKKHSISISYKISQSDQECKKRSFVEVFLTRKGRSSLKKKKSAVLQTTQCKIRIKIKNMLYELQSCLFDILPSYNSLGTSNKTNVKCVFFVISSLCQS